MKLTKIPYKILLALTKEENRYKNTARLGKQTEMTITSVVNGVRILEENKLIERKPLDNKNKIISLTDNGKEVTKKLIELKDLGIEL